VKFIEISEMVLRDIVFLSYSLLIELYIKFVILQATYTIRFIMPLRSVRRPSVVNFFL